MNTRVKFSFALSVVLGFISIEGICQWVPNVPLNRITTVRDVGIGTTAPERKLHILTGGGFQTCGTALRLEYQQLLANGCLPGSSIWDVTAFQDGNMRISTIDGASGAPLDVMTLTNFGNVGIGTTTPLARLHVFQNVTTEAALLIHKVTQPTASGNILEIRKGSPTVSGLVMVVADTGNVGIGTAFPGNRLDVNGGAAFQGNHIYVRNQVSPGGNQTWGLVVSSADGRLNIGQTSDTPPSGGSLSSVPFKIFPGAPNNSIVINSNGNVGIGTSTPSEKLTVIGDGKFDGNLQVCNTINTERVIVEIQSCDFVFDPVYERPTPFEKEAWYKKFRHLMGVDSGDYIEKHGFDLGKNASGMIMNIEENGLDIIEGYKTNLRQDDDIIALKKKNKELKLKCEELEKRLEALENK